MALILFDNTHRKSLFPFSATKAVAALRFGILTMQERWEHLSKQKVYLFTKDYLLPLYSSPPAGMHIWIDASIIPTHELCEKILSLSPHKALTDSKNLVAVKTGIAPNNFLENDFVNDAIQLQNIKRLEHPWQIFQWNDAMIQFDFQLLTKHRISSSINKTNTLIQPENIFIEEGAEINCSVINAQNGSVYIGKNAIIMEGCTLRGPLAICENATIKMGTKVYGATTIGKNAVAGGEIKNSVLQDYSNKAHHGYLGDSVIGEWCNLGAGTTNSNVKNNAGTVTMWSEAQQAFLPVAQKCGMLMGDYSKNSY